MLHIFFLNPTLLLNLTSQLFIFMLSKKNPFIAIHKWTCMIDSLLNLSLIHLGFASQTILHSLLKNAKILKNKLMQILVKDESTSDNHMYLKKITIIPTTHTNAQLKILCIQHG